MGTRYVLRRLEHRDASGAVLFNVGGDLMELAGGATVEIPLGEAGDETAWWELPLPLCPDCEQTAVVPAEAGRVPGARACPSCRSVFVVDPARAAP